MFIDNWEIMRLNRDRFQLMKTRVSVKKNEAREIYKGLLSHGGRKT